MINKPERLPEWSTFMAKLRQKSARQTSLDTYLDAPMQCGAIGASRVLKALKKKQIGGEKI